MGVAAVGEPGRRLHMRLYTRALRMRNVLGNKNYFSCTGGSFKQKHGEIKYAGQYLSKSWGTAIWSSPKDREAPQAPAVTRWCLTCEVGPDRRRTIAFVASDFKCGRLSSWQILVLHLWAGHREYFFSNHRWLAQLKTLKFEWIYLHLPLPDVGSLVYKRGHDNHQWVVQLEHRWIPTETSLK